MLSHLHVIQQVGTRVCHELDLFCSQDLGFLFPHLENGNNWG